jgi:hypothetical protein
VAKRAGTADLPLHNGRVPLWLAERMARLGTIMVEAVILHYGRAELLRRLANPFWFQCFGAVMGMDWHSSGITTSVLGALKRGLKPRARELGLHVCGGRGRHSRATPQELVALGELLSLDGAGLARTSRLIAKVDSAALQDGFDLYLHGFILADDGGWVVVQQGMNGASRLARRYHWRSEGLTSFVDDPHAAIAGLPEREAGIVNLADRRAADSRAAQLGLLGSLGPDKLAGEIAKLNRTSVPARPAPPREPELPYLVMPAHHDVRGEDINDRRLHATLAAAADRAPADFPDLLLTPGLGARTVEALALVAEVLHGAPCRFADPGRFSLAHGGKDRHPYPVPVKVYDETIRVLKSAVTRAKLGRTEELAALQRLDDQARALEGHVAGPSPEAFMAKERGLSHRYGGRSVFGRKPAPEDQPQVA